MNLTGKGVKSKEIERRHSESVRSRAKIAKLQHQEGRAKEKVEMCSVAVPSEVCFGGCNDDLLYTILTSVEEK